MQVKSISYQSFTSRNNPVEDFKIVTNKGSLLVKEFTHKDAENHDNIYSLSKFFIDGFLSNTEDPVFLKFAKPENRQKYLEFLERMTAYYKSMFKKDDGNLTVLVAKDEKGELAGAIVSNTLSEEGVSEKSTCYIDSIAVAPHLRNNKVGATLENKILEFAQKAYTDVFLASDNMAVGFQLKNGFRALDYSNPPEKRIIDKINSVRGDYPDYVTYMDKKIGESSIPWYERASIEG